MDIGNILNIEMLDVMFVSFSVILPSGWRGPLRQVRGRGRLPLVLHPFAEAFGGHVVEELAFEFVFDVLQGQHGNALVLPSGLAQVLKIVGAPVLGHEFCQAGGRCAVGWHRVLIFAQVGLAQFYSSSGTGVARHGGWCLLI